MKKYKLEKAFRVVQTYLEFCQKAYFVFCQISKSGEDILNHSWAIATHFGGSDLDLWSWPLKSI